LLGDTGGVEYPACCGARHCSWRWGLGLSTRMPSLELVVMARTWLLKQAPMGIDMNCRRTKEDDATGYRRMVVPYLKRGLVCRLACL
jgi:hypothetical protein